MPSAGTHLIVDGYVSHSAVFAAHHLGELFERLARELNMRIIMGPTFLDVPLDHAALERMRVGGAFEDEGGTTGFAIISTSHMAIHCWPLRRYLSFDAYSCKAFDADVAFTVLREHLDLDSWNAVVLDRERPGTGLSAVTRTIAGHAPTMPSAGGL